MKKTVLKDAGVLLIVAVMVLSTIAATANTVKDQKSISDLVCTGDLRWEGVEPGITVTGSFTVENAGDSGSELNWEISEYPYWGSNWTFTPYSGTGLTPEAGPVSVDVSVVAPPDEDTEFAGIVKVINSDDSSDSCSIDVYMMTLGESAENILLDEDFSGAFPPEGWETDYWKQVDSNYSGGKAPEAQVYKYDQYNDGQYYDNYIQTCQIDCSDFEKVNLRFRWASDMYYPQYCEVFVKFRRNSASPWNDVTPWDNPIGANQDPGYHEIDIYGWGEDLGEGFQIKWEYIGYYYYFNYFWLDDVTVEAETSLPEADQKSIIINDFEWISAYGAWQEFIPTMDKLDLVSMPIAQDFIDSDMLVLDILDWNDTVLRSLSKPASDFPYVDDYPWNWSWTPWNIEDLNITPHRSYKIRLHWSGNAKYAWAGADLDPDGPYPEGESSVGPTWDFGFITWGYNKFNTPPDPILKGPDEGATTIPYSFHIRASDPDGDNVYYRFDWGEGAGWTSWDGPYHHLTWIEYQYTWTTYGLKTIRFQVKDEFGNEPFPKEKKINISDYDDITEEKYVDVYMDYDPTIQRARGLKKPDEEELKPGNTVKYSILVCNNGTKKANNVQVDFNLLGFSIPNITVDVPAKKCTMATTTWTIPTLDQSEQVMIKHSGLNIEIFHPEDVNITPYNRVFSNFNFEGVPTSPPYYVIHPVYIYNSNNGPLDVIIDVELLEPEPAYKEWEVYVRPTELTIYPGEVDKVYLQVIPPKNISLGDKCEAVVSAYEVMKETRDKGEPIQSEGVRTVYDVNSPTINIDNPRNAFYLLDRWKIRFPWTIIIGKITIEGEASDVEGEVDKVYLYIDGSLKQTFYDEKFSWEWKQISYLKRHTIKVEANDGLHMEPDDVKIIKII